MGHIIIQSIYTCDLCGKTPKDGEKLWHMNSEVWCEACCSKVDSIMDTIIKAKHQSYILPQQA